MRLKLYSYNGTQINDHTNYDAFLPRDMDLQGDSSPIFINRPDFRPAYAGKILNDLDLTFYIKINGTLSTALDTLKALFNTGDTEVRKLIAKDVDNSDKQWYVYCTPKSMKNLKRTTLEVTVSIADPVWYEETESTDTWTITATGQQKTVTPAGNLPTRPRFVITPTQAGVGGYAYKKFLLAYNPTFYAMPDYPLEITAGGWNTSAAAAGAVLKNSTNYVLIDDADGITDSDTTITFDGEVGTLPSSGMAMIEDEQIYYTGKSATQLTGVTRGYGDSTAAAHANNAEIYQSKILKNGDDVRVFIDGAEVNRWLDGMYTTSSKVWANVSFKPKVELTLNADIANPHTALSVIYYQPTYANKLYVKSMPPSGKLLIGSELFSYSAIDQNKYAFTGIVPSIYGTSSAAHSIGDTIRWVEHDIWLMYGSPTATDPTTGISDYDDKKPIIDINASTNTSWVYAEFWDTNRKRTGAWTPSKTGTGLDPVNGLGYYTGNRTALADPATEMGMSAYAWQVGSYWRSGLAIIEWRLYHPAGVTTVTATGEKYRYTANWPYMMFNKCLNNGITWLPVWTETTPSAAQTWEALASHSAVSLSGDYQYLRFYCYGYVGATANNCVHMEIEAMTLALQSTKVPQLTLSAEQNNYHLQAKITNTSNVVDGAAEYIQLNYGMELNSSLTVDCENKTITHSSGANAAQAITVSTVRPDWLNLLAAANVLQYDDVGTTNISITVAWRDRNS